jgi:hypothetical protein
VTNELLRQLMEMKGFYSLEKPGDFNNIVDVHYLGLILPNLIPAENLFSPSNFGQSSTRKIRK